MRATSTTPAAVGPLAVGGDLLEGQRRRPVVVGPQVEVVVEHPGGPAGQPARRTIVTPSRIVVSTHTTRGSATSLSLNARRAVAVGFGLGPLEDPAVEQGVVGQDDPALGQLGQDRLEVGVVAGLVGVDEDQVEGALQAGQGLEGRPFHHADARRRGGWPRCWPGRSPRGAGPPPRW